LRLRFNFKTIKFRVWVYFLLFAIVLMILMWFLQILFLNFYYSDMKQKRLENMAVSISSSYKESGTKNLKKLIQDDPDGDDSYVLISKNDQTLYPEDPLKSYDKSISEARSGLNDPKNASKDPNNPSKTKSDRYESTIPTEGTSQNSFVYAQYMDASDGSSDTILFIISPLYPVASTISILQNQLLYIMIIALAMAFIISFYLSSKISRPITTMTRSARKLADGQYGITFPAKTEYTEISDLAKTLNKISYDLERSTMLQKDLMANVSHDLRTPLTMIKSYAEMIRDLSGDNPEKRNAHLKVIIEEADRLNSLVSDMLTLSAMQSGTLSIDMSSFDISESINAILMPYHILEERDGFDIEFNCRRGTYVEGDDEKIRQVISNLLTNAVKYCGTDKKIIINVKRWGKKVHCEVVDHGVGIKPEELSHIWDRYYKTSSNHVRTTSGSGLGLSIVKEILTLHGAKFGAESKVGKGTTIWFELNAVNPPKDIIV